MRGKSTCGNRAIGSDPGKCLVADSGLLGDSSDRTELARNRLCIASSNGPGERVIAKT